MSQQANLDPENLPAHYICSHHSNVYNAGYNSAYIKCYDLQTALQRDINEGKLYKLTTPLISVDTGKQRDYFYSLTEFEEWSKRKKSVSGLRYLKGLGSLSIQDWETVMQNKKLIQIKKGSDAAKWIDMAFGNSSELRKKWLSGNFK